MDQVDAHRRNRTLREHHAAVEACTAYLTDIHGRFWVSTKRRDRPGQVEDLFFGAGTPDRLNGTLIDGLTGVAQAARVLVHGLPPLTGGEAAP